MFIIKSPLHMSIISGIIFDHQWQHSKADSDQTSIKRPVLVMWPWDTTSSENSGRGTTTS